MRRRLLYCVAIGLLLAAAGQIVPSRAWSAETAQAMGPAVKLVIDYNDGCQKIYGSIPWTSGMTVWDVLAAAQQMRHPILVQKTGSAPRDFFVTRIDDLGNEGGGSGKRNWVYWVDGAMAQSGAGTQQVKTGQTILFKFALPDQAS